MPSIKDIEQEIVADVEKIFSKQKAPEAAPMETPAPAAEDGPYMSEATKAEMAAGIAALKKAAGK